MKLEPTDYEMMARALNLATKGIYTSTPNPSVGCVITQNGKIVGGLHQASWRKPR